MDFLENPITSYYLLTFCQLFAAFDYTWVDESIQRLFHGILEGYFRGCSGLFRGDLGRFLVDK